jgi:hypothetical protein
VGRAFESGGAPLINIPIGQGGIAKHVGLGRCSIKVEGRRWSGRSRFLCFAWKNAQSPNKTNTLPSPGTRPTQRRVSDSTVRPATFFRCAVVAGHAGGEGRIGGLKTQIDWPPIITLTCQECRKLTKAEFFLLSVSIVSETLIIFLFSLGSSLPFRLVSVPRESIVKQDAKDAEGLKRACAAVVHYEPHGGRL